MYFPGIRTSGTNSANGTSQADSIAARAESQQSARSGNKGENTGSSGGDKIDISAAMQAGAASSGAYAGKWSITTAGPNAATDAATGGQADTGEDAATKLLARAGAEAEKTMSGGLEYMFAAMEARHARMMRDAERSAEEARRSRTDERADAGGTPTEKSAEQSQYEQSIAAGAIGAPGGSGTAAPSAASAATSGAASAAPSATPSATSGATSGAPTGIPAESGDNALFSGGPGSARDSGADTHGQQGRKAGAYARQAAADRPMTRYSRDI